MKRCCTCQVDKPLSEFNKNKRSKDGLQDRCRPCCKAWYVENRVEHRQNVNRASGGRDRDCVDCDKPFTGRHASCPQCRYARSRIPCQSCGRPISNKAKSCMPCLGDERRGAGNPTWKGGRTYHTKGYVYAWEEGHSRATPNGYVLEHLLVMEQVLGRPLLPGENVHHVNGIKCDNRPENLELWIKPQPSGVRVEDAVAWAKEILNRYGSMSSS